jgi:hypothetical protein
MYTHADCKMRETYVGSNTKDPVGRPAFYKRSEIRSFFSQAFPNAFLSIKTNDRAHLVSASPPLLSFDETSNASIQSPSLGSCSDLNQQESARPRSPEVQSLRR